MAAVLGAVLTAWAPPAEACTPGPPPPHVLDGYPADGATGVPTDVIPVYDSYLMGSPTLEGQSVFLLRTAEGDAIPLVMSTPYRGTATLTPETALAPSTEYTLESNVHPVGGAQPVFLTATFTTGDGPSPAPNAVSGAYFEHYETRAASACFGPTLQGTCLVLPPGSFVTARFMNELGAEQDPYLYFRSTFADVIGISEGSTFQCVRLRTRAPNGAESDPVELCRAGAPLYEYTGNNWSIECTDDGLTFAGDPPEEAPGVSLRGSASIDDGGGCTVSRSPARHDAAWLGILATAGLVLSREHRRRRRR